MISSSDKHPPVIWTIGHSTLAAEEFFSQLTHNQIQVLADVRRFPMSKRYPHFNKNELMEEAERNGIDYIHFESLGGRRKPIKDSKNSGWKNLSFRGYADYMETEEFQSAVGILEEKAMQENVCIMCSEAVWWRCHRALISDYLKRKGWRVLHIPAKGKPAEHPFTTVARQQVLF